MTDFAIEPGGTRDLEVHVMEQDDGFLGNSDDALGAVAFRVRSLSAGQFRIEPLASKDASWESNTVGALPLRIAFRVHGANANYVFWLEVE